MRTLHRLIAAGALSAPLLIGAAGMASADAEYGQTTAVAGPNGAWFHSVHSVADDHGNACFHEHAAAAGPDGAGSFSVHACAGHGYHGGHHGDGGSATYFSQESFASDEGAYSNTTYAHADNDWDDD